jgi:hypothetical protein
MSKQKNTILLSLLVFAASACSSGSSNKGETTTATQTDSIAAVVPAQELPSAEDILQRSIEASGGEALLRAITSYRMTGTMSIPAQKISGELEVVGASGARLVVNVKIPGIGNERSGSDGTTVWSMSAMTGSRILTGAERERTLRDSDLLKELNWKQYYKSAETMGAEEVDGKAAYIVKLVDNADVAETRFYNQESGLLVRQSGIVKSQMGEMKNVMHFRDFKTMGGVVMASTIEVEVMGLKQLITTTSVEINPEVSDETFALPSEIKEIAAAAK